MKIKLLIAALLLGGIGTGFAWQYLQINKLSAANSALIEENGQLDLAIRVQNHALEQLENSLDSVIENTQHLTQQINQAEQERQRINNELNGFRGRLSHVAIKKPSLIERRANNAFANVLREFQTATSGHSANPE